MGQSQPGWPLCALPALLYQQKLPLGAIHLTARKAEKSRFYTLIASMAMVLVVAVGCNVITVPDHVYMLSYKGAWLDHNSGKPQAGPDLRP